MGRRHRLLSEGRELAERAAALLAKDARVRLVYVFGSAAGAGNVRVHDVDVGILTDRPQPQDELMKWRADLVAAAGGPIDLVSLNDAPVMLAHEVVEHGRCLYARDPGVEIEFVTHARARYWDFKPFREEQWRLAGERLKEREVGP